MTQRIIIHAGFPKCGSTSIQAALIHNFGRLQKDGVFLFGKELRVAQTSADLGVPLWFLEQAKEKGEPLAQRLSDEIASLRVVNGDRIAILSAENLSRPEMAPLFAGLDSRLEVSLIFYLRPQLEWIPSAWKQWGLKKGMSLSDLLLALLPHVLRAEPDHPGRDRIREDDDHHGERNSDSAIHDPSLFPQAWPACSSAAQCSRLRFDGAQELVQWDIASTDHSRDLASTISGSGF